MNEGSIQSLIHHLLALIHKTHTRQRQQGEGTADNWQLLFHEQVFVFMSINETRVQLNEAN